jgi:hypothetical protein
MLTHIRAAGAAHRARPQPPFQPPERGDGLLEQIADVENEHILLLGHHGVDLMCALLRAGALEVTHLNSPERAEPESATIVIVPRMPSHDWLADALRSIGRILLPTGRLILCVSSAADVVTVNRVRRTLARHGYSKIHATKINSIKINSTKIDSGMMHTSQDESCLLISAELPAFGLRKVA